jgi:ribosomal protein S18 acetylase RimI-like enzyme
LSIERMARRDRANAVVTLSRAFQDDPLLCFLVPDPLSRARALLTIMNSVLVDAAPLGEVWVARQGPTITGVAGWLPPGAYPRGIRRETTSVIRDLRSAHRLGRRALSGMRIYAAIDRAHSQVDEPHWYLAVLGTDPAWQRRGVGSALVAEVLQRIDKDGMRAYLETTKPENVPWYRHHGFEVVTEIDARGCPKVWAMGRHPRLSGDR